MESYYANHNEHDRGYAQPTYHAGTNGILIGTYTGLNV
jgi:hypothetical protein